jgi:hypothetical protein
VPAAPLGADAAPAPLSERIDREIDGALPGAVAEPSGDLEFLRRLSIDLIGRVPSAAEARQFLADAGADKRARKIDGLLESPEFSRRFASFLDVWFLERLPDKHVPAAEWQKFLLGAVSSRKPLNTIIGMVLESDGADPVTRPAARFALARDGDPYRLTRDIGRLFLGRDMSCAQCHDHPLIRDYLQADYHGLFAFLGRTSLFTAKDQTAMLAEKADGEFNFISVFDPEKKSRFARPRLPESPPLEEPFFEGADLYIVAPAKDVRAVPRFSRRQALARALTNGAAAAFNRNLANRLWAFLMGRGLVQPLDLDHAANPPSHPRLLDLLARELAAADFDVRRFLGQIARTRAYQRSSRMPPVTVDAEIARRALAEAKERAARLGDLAAASAQALARGERDFDGFAERLAAALAAEGRSQAALAAVEEERCRAHAALQESGRTLELESAARALADARDRLREAMRAPELAGELQEALAKIDARASALSADLAKAREVQTTTTASITDLEGRLAAALREAESARARLEAFAAEGARLQRSFAELQAGRERDRQAADAALVEQKSAESLAAFCAMNAAAEAAGPVPLAALPGPAAQALADLWSRRLAVAPLKPLGPEALGWSLLEALGIMDRPRQELTASLRQEAEKQAAAAGGEAELASKLERGLNERMAPKVRPFIGLFAAMPGQPEADFQATVQQALFLQNGDTLGAWTRPEGGNLAERLAAMEDAKAVAEELYLSVLTRTPSAEEAAEVAAIAAGAPAERAASISDLLWALATSVEFRFNH